MLTPVPDTLDVDRLGKVPNLLLGVDRVVVTAHSKLTVDRTMFSSSSLRRVHDTSIIELCPVSKSRSVPKEANEDD